MILLRAGRTLSALMMISLLMELPSISEATAADLSAKIGLAQTKLKPRNRESSITINGALFSVGIAWNVLPNLLVGTNFKPIVNFATKEVSRNALEGSLQYSLIGGTRRHTKTTEWGTIDYFGGSNLYVSNNVEIQQYQTFISNTAGTIDGSVICSKIGLGYRYDWSTTKSIGFEFTTSYLSFANSGEGLSVSEQEVFITTQWEIN